jgi:hypothetical protein
MSTESPDGIDRAAIAENAQRTVERSALRKVRKALDRAEADRARERRLLRNTLIVCAVLAAIGAFAILGILTAGPGTQGGQAIQLPASGKP